MIVDVDGILTVLTTGLGLNKSLSWGGYMSIICPIALKTVLHDSELVIKFSSV
jgi:hypothetical protein